MYDPAAIAFNKAALLRIVMALFAMVGVERGGVVAMLPRGVRLVIVRHLRAAEAAGRRLAVAVASQMTPRDAPKRAPPTQPIPKGTGPSDRLPAFPLFDRRKSFTERRQRARGMPQISVFGYGERVVAAPKPQPDDARDAARVCRRLEALARALDDLPKQARRLLRVQARRHHAPPGPRRVGPLRPGWPPGYRRRWSHPVDSVLYNCHVFALRALEPPARSPADKVAA